MSRGLPHRSSSYGYYSGGPPYKRQRRLSEEDIGPSGVNYGPGYYDPPYVRHQFLCKAVCSEACQSFESCLSAACEKAPR
ncbi:hypothetical protein ACROYT_G010908 [Oculina patagonica]